MIYHCLLFLITIFLVPSQASKAWSFPGSSADYYFMVNPLVLPPKFTIETWIYPVSQLPNQYWLSWASSGDSSCLLGDFEIPVGTWRHVIITYDGTSTFGYVNGVYDANILSNSFCGDHTGSLVFGQKQGSVGGGFSSSKSSNMLLDTVAIYNTSWPASYISSVSNNTCVDNHDIDLYAVWYGERNNTVVETTGSDYEGTVVAENSTKGLTYDCYFPTSFPTISSLPTSLPTSVPSPSPISLPTNLPSNVPTPAPTPLPSSLPTLAPSPSPTSLPTSLPSNVPTSFPSLSPFVSKAWSFPGSSTDYYFMVNPLVLPQKFTIETWIYPISNTGTHYWFSWAGSVTDDSNCLIGEMVMPIGSWQHMIITYDGTSTLAYINGVYDASILYNSFCGDHFGSLVLGQEQDSVGGGFDASQSTHMLLDTVAIYNTSWSASYISSIADNTCVDKHDVDLYAVWQGKGNNNTVVETTGSDYEGTVVAENSTKGLTYDCYFPTSFPTISLTPTYLPTSLPTIIPSSVPTFVPSTLPTPSPTSLPTITSLPTPLPTPFPTPLPTISLLPTYLPTPVPTNLPTYVPTPSPSPQPTPVPTSLPTYVPTSSPSPQPTPVPTSLPTYIPTPSPSPLPTPVPTLIPTYVPTPSPSPLPTPVPTLIPTYLPSMVPTSLPSGLPTSLPTASPTPLPSSAPTPLPTIVPTSSPSLPPSPSPTLLPTSYNFYIDQATIEAASMTVSAVMGAAVAGAVGTSVAGGGAGSASSSGAQGGGMQGQVQMVFAIQQIAISGKLGAFGDGYGDFVDGFGWANLQFAPPKFVDSYFDQGTSSESSRKLLVACNGDDGDDECTANQRERYDNYVNNKRTMRGNIFYCIILLMLVSFLHLIYYVCIIKPYKKKVRGLAHFPKLEMCFFILVSTGLFESTTSILVHYKVAELSYLCIAAFTLCFIISFNIWFFYTLSRKLFPKHSDSIKVKKNKQKKKNQNKKNENKMSTHTSSSVSNVNRKDTPLLPTVIFIERRVIPDTIGCFQSKSDHIQKRKKRLALAYEKAEQKRKEMIELQQNGFSNTNQLSNKKKNSLSCCSFNRYCCCRYCCLSIFKQTDSLYTLPDDHFQSFDAKDLDNLMMVSPKMSSNMTDRGDDNDDDDNQDDNDEQYFLTWRECSRSKKLWIILFSCTNFKIGEWTPTGASDEHVLKGYRVLDRWGPFFTDMTPEFRFYYIFGMIKSLFLVIFLIGMSSTPIKQAFLTFAVEGSWVVMLINSIPCADMLDTRIDIGVNMFKLLIYLVAVLASSGVLDPTSAGALALLFGMGTLGFSVLAQVIMVLDFMLSFGGNNGHGDVRSYMKDHDDLKKEIQEANKWILVSLLKDIAHITVDTKNQNQNQNQNNKNNTLSKFPDPNSAPDDSNNNSSNNQGNQGVVVVVHDERLKVALKDLIDQSSELLLTVMINALEEIYAIFQSTVSEEVYGSIEDREEKAIELVIRFLERRMKAQRGDWLSRVHKDQYLKEGSRNGVVEDEEGGHRHNINNGDDIDVDDNEEKKDDTQNDNHQRSISINNNNINNNNNNNNTRLVLSSKTKTATAMLKLGIIPKQRKVLYSNDDDRKVINMKEYIKRNRLLLRGSLIHRSIKFFEQSLHAFLIDQIDQNDSELSELFIDQIHNNNNNNNDDDVDNDVFSVLSKHLNEQVLKSIPGLADMAIRSIRSSQLSPFKELLSEEDEESLQPITSTSTSTKSPIGALKNMFLEKFPSKEEYQYKKFGASNQNNTSKNHRGSLQERYGAPFQVQSSLHQQEKDEENEGNKSTSSFEPSHSSSSSSSSSSASSSDTDDEKPFIKKKKSFIHQDSFSPSLHKDAFVSQKSIDDDDLDSNHLPHISQDQQGDGVSPHEQTQKEEDFDSHRKSKFYRDVKEPSQVSQMKNKNKFQQEEQQNNNEEDGNNIELLEMMHSLTSEPLVSPSHPTYDNDNEILQYNVHHNNVHRIDGGMDVDEMVRLARLHFRPKNTTTGSQKYRLNSLPSSPPPQSAAAPSSALPPSPPPSSSIKSSPTSRQGTNNSTGGLSHHQSSNSIRSPKTSLNKTPKRNASSPSVKSPVRKDKVSPSNNRTSISPTRKSSLVKDRVSATNSRNSISPSRKSSSVKDRVSLSNSRPSVSPSRKSSVVSNTGNSTNQKASLRTKNDPISSTSTRGSSSVKAPHTLKNNTNVRPRVANEEIDLADQLELNSRRVQSAPPAVPIHTPKEEVTQQEVTDQDLVKYKRKSVYL